MLRAVLGFVVAAVLWMPAFFTLTALVALAWPAYAGLAAPAVLLGAALAASRASGRLLHAAH